MPLRPKKDRPNRLSFLWLIPFAFLFACQVFPRFTQDSPAGDEVLDVVDGYSYWKGDLSNTPQHPPLIKALQSLPFLIWGRDGGLSVTGPSKDYGSFFYVANRDRFEGLLAVSRSVSLLFGLGIGVLLFLILRQEPRPVVLTALTLWAFEPALLAFSGFSMVDVPMTFLFLAAVWKFSHALEKPAVRNYVMTGLLAGMAVSAKFSALLLIPVFLALEILLRPKSEGRDDGSLTKVGQRWMWGLGAAAVWIFLTYLPVTLLGADHHGPFHYFWSGLQAVPGILRQPNYFCGLLRRDTHWDYYPVAFLLKSPLPFLALLFLGTLLTFTKRTPMPHWFWAAPLLFFAVSMPFHDLGIREILPIYPFLILVAAKGGGWLWVQKSRFGKAAAPLVVAGLLIFQVMSVALSFPGQVSYFNESVPEDKRVYWLGDSNLDIGQDTKRLALFAQARGWDQVTLAYFGDADPSLYGMRWDYWSEKDLAGPRPGRVYAINDEFIQLGQAFLPGASAVLKSWIVSAKPTGRIGDTWYYFVIPGTPMDDPSARILSAPPFLYTRGSKN